ncbi:MAG TPA: sigma-70 family RNA polymerase sigma factor, partial [Cyclobacteriaceae bacterium]|nr:sigma-70 family RNA polymerase sigma factor [Cyclobacteriaceae bacterium]
MTVESFNNEFESIATPLKSFLLRITASIADAEDLVQDTYLKALEKLNTFREESSLKTWVFTIASNLAKDNLRAQKRWSENVTDISRTSVLHDEQFLEEAMNISTSSPQGRFEVKEHVAFCFTCISKSLPLEQQLCIFLKEVYEFK